MKAFNEDSVVETNSSESNSHQRSKRLAVSIIGDNIYNPEGEALGKVSDIMIDMTEGKIEYIVMESGGFLGMNQKLSAVPFQALTIAKEHRNSFILNETKESLKRFPAFDKDHWPDMKPSRD